MYMVTFFFINLYLHYFFVFYFTDYHNNLMKWLVSRYLVNFAWMKTSSGHWSKMTNGVIFFLLFMATFVYAEP